MGEFDDLMAKYKQEQQTQKAKQLSFSVLKKPY